VAKRQGAEVLVQVKANQPELLAACQRLAESRQAAQVDVELSKAHGRIEQRTTQLFAHPPGWLPDDWAVLLPTVIRVQRHRTERVLGHHYRTTDETAWYGCTTPMAVTEAAQAIRGHWGIENQLHYVRDVTLREDACRVRHNPGILARIRTMALNILHHNRVQHISETLFRNAVSLDHLIALNGL
jgi:hypothetical protein